MKLTLILRYSISSLILLQILSSYLSFNEFSIVRTLDTSLQSITTPYNKQSFGTQSAYKHTVLLDAGHGGKDHGCSGFSHREKDFTLAFAKELGAKIEYFSDDIKVIYTREYDETVSLNKRVAMANQASVDLLVSVHANHGASPDYHGFETYVYGEAQSEADASLVYREESHNYDASTPTAEIADHILNEMSKSQSQENSFRLGAIIAASIDALPGLRNRGIKQAEFRVLKKAQVPSILLEIGYLTNQKDVRFLTDVKQRNRLSETLAKSIIAHLE